jgi:hypothetical protein
MSSRQDHPLKKFKIEQDRMKKYTTVHTYHTTIKINPQPYLWFSTSSSPVNVPNTVSKIITQTYSADELLIYYSSDSDPCAGMQSLSVCTTASIPSRIVVTDFIPSTG